jgi:hypothetical protein
MASRSATATFTGAEPTVTITWSPPLASDDYKIFDGIEGEFISVRYPTKTASTLVVEPNVADFVGKVHVLAVES